MKHNHHYPLSLFILLAGLLALTAQAEVPDWENQAVFGINKLPPRTSVATLCQSCSRPWREIPPPSDYYESLNGDWQFHWSPDPEQPTHRFLSARLRR